ncbi:MAG: glycosyltransferase family 25 protein [Chitinophagaceae bacterium]|nr:glycosyltransferase family 25 protein [Chitinophagaceae bacterium]
MQKYSYKIYLINLDRSPDRLSRMRDEFGRNGITDFERIAAVDGKVLTRDSYIAKDKFKRRLVAGEFACYLSHIKVLQQFLKEDQQFAVILEDDITIAPNFKEGVEKAINNNYQLPEKKRWDILKLWNRNRRHIRIADIDDKHFIGLCGTSIPGGTLGAVWTRKGAEKFLRKVFSGNDLPTIGRPIDCDLQHPWEFGLIIYNLLPSVVLLHELPSVIDELRAEKRSTFIGGIRYQLNRLIPKYKYYISLEGFRKFWKSFVLKKNEIVL